MNSEAFNDFLTDVRNLYYKTRLSSVENCYIRLSQASQPHPSNAIDIVDFIRWINNSKNVKSEGSVLRKISDPTILDAFVYLYNVTSRWQSIQNDTDSFRKEIFKQSPKIIEIINTMGRMINDDSVNFLLKPFYNAIELIGRIVPIPPTDESLLKRDLQIIYQNYIQNQTNQRESLQNMFTFLLNKFIQDIAAALNNVGKKDLASKILSEKILWRPDLLSKVIPVGNIDHIMGDKIQDMISHMAYRSNNMESAYEYVKREALDFVGAIDQSQYNLESAQNLSDADLKNIQKGQGIKGKEYPPIKIEDAKWLHPRSLAIISATLYSIYRKIKGF